MQQFFINNKVHFINIFFLFLLSLIMVKDSVFSNKAVTGEDTKQFSAVNNSNDEYKKQNPNSPYPSWNRSLFSGMPNYFITGVNKGEYAQYNIVSKAVQYLQKFLYSTQDHFFYMSLFFYLLCITIGVQGIAALVGGIIFAYASNTSILLVAGHMTKVITLDNIPIVLIGYFLIDKKKYLLGTLIMGIGLIFVNVANHTQIAYYFHIIIFLMIVYGIYSSYKLNITTKEIIKNVLSKSIAILIGISFILFSSLQVRDYAKNTIRGGSVLSSNNDNSPQPKSSGLDKSYAFQWSYGMGESFMLGFPNIYGGASGTLLGDDSKTYQYLTSRGVADNQAKNFVYSLSTYWGDKPFTSGPIYVGITTICLFVFCIFYLKSRYKRPIILIMALALLHSWGSNFSILNYLLFDYVPFLNKFRDHSMILSFIQLLIALLVALTLNQLYNEKNIQSLTKPLKHTAYTLLGILAFILLLYLTFKYDAGNKDAELLQNLIKMTNQNDFANQILNALKQDRRHLFLIDIIKFVIYGGLTLGAIWALMKQKIKPRYFILFIGLLVTIDLMTVSKLYLNDSNFRGGKQSKGLSPTATDKKILEDKDNNYRVFNYNSSNPFSDANPSAFHRNVAGYHAAKLSIYQDLIERHISQNNPKVLNMLNVKYFIGKNDQYQINPNALGACWLVDSIIYANNPEEAINSLNTFDERHTAVLEKSQVGNENMPSKLEVSEFDNIRNTHASPDTMIYVADVKSNSFAVFSEVYYPKEWKAKVDNEPVKIYKTNYALRGIFLKPGKHEIVFTFQPTYGKYEQYVTLLVGNIVPLLLLFIVIKPYISKRRRKTISS